MAPPVYHFERVASTMDVIHALAEQGAELGTVVLAGEQLEGRGSRGRSWHSPPGGLWLSALFRPAASAGLEVMSLRVGLALAKTLDRFVPVPIGIKWPNDLMLGDRKMGGVLCEARWQGTILSWVAVGVGLNVRNPIPEGLGGVATSLAQDQRDFPAEALLDAVIAGLRQVDLSAPRLTNEELAQFSRRHWLNGRDIREPVVGTVANLESDGTLRVRVAGGSPVQLRNASIELATVTPIA